MVFELSSEEFRKSYKGAIMLNIIYLTLINLIAFIAYGCDKHKAKKGQWRIPEKTLIFFAVIGGAFGAGLGMLIFHHKTQKKKFYLTVPAFVLIWSVIIGCLLYQNLHIVISEYEYKSAEVPENLDGYRIVQISDLHNEFYGPSEGSLIQKIEDAKPDVIFVTGDVVDSTFTNYDLAYDFFEGAVKIAPVYYVTGNHEVRLMGERFDSFVSDLENIGVCFLDNKKTDLSGYTLIGISDKSLGFPPEELKETDSDKLTICLAHEPAYHDSYLKVGADIAFTGHIHGGQFNIPGKGGFISPDFEFFPDLYEGAHEFSDGRNSLTMYISRGLGNSIIPQRLNNYPEIVVVILRRQ